MMLSPSMVKSLIVNLHLSIRDEDHLKQLMNGLCLSINDKHIDGSFDAFAFAWGLLPQWAKVLLLSVAYRENKKAFDGITPLTPIDLLSSEQRILLSGSCDKLLTAVITLMADHHFTEDFYSGWRDARRIALQPRAQTNTLLEQAA